MRDGGRVEGGPLEALFAPKSTVTGGQNGANRNPFTSRQIIPGRGGGMRVTPHEQSKTITVTLARDAAR